MFFRELKQYVTKTTKRRYNCRYCIVYDRPVQSLFDLSINVREKFINDKNRKIKQ